MQEGRWEENLPFLGLWSLPPFCKDGKTRASPLQSCGLVRQRRVRGRKIGYPGRLLTDVNAYIVLPDVGSELVEVFRLYLSSVVCDTSGSLAISHLVGQYLEQSILS